MSASTTSAAAPAAGVNPHDASQPWFEATVGTVQDFDTVQQRYRLEVELDVTPERLFEIFADPVSWTVWCPGIARVDWTSPEPFGVGTTRTVTFTGGMQIYEEFVAWQAPTEMAFWIDGGTQEVWHRFGEHYAVTDLGGGRCKLVWTVGYEPRGTFAAIHFLVKPTMGLALAWFMRRLKRYCRAHPG